MAGSSNAEKVENPALAIGNSVTYVVLAAIFNRNAMLGMQCARAVVKRDVTKKYDERL